VKIKLAKTILVFLCLLSFSVLAESESSDSITNVSVSSGPSHLTSSPGGGNAGGQTMQTDEFSGASTYSVTIPVPPSRGGIEPQLVLDYNSHRRNPNSWVGYGWEMDLGSFQRLPDNGIVDYYEGQSFQVRFGGQTETLYLKEENKNVSSAYGISLNSGERADEYQAKIESSFNIYLHIRDHSNPDEILDAGWIVIDKGGRTYSFGSTEGSRIEAYACDAGETEGACTEKHRVSKWMLDNVTDPNNNELNIDYTNTSKVISSISYQDIEINFSFYNYGTRFTQFRQSFIDDDGLGSRLKKITVSDSTGALQLFKFAYNKSSWNNYYYLESLTQYNGDETEFLPSTDFTYYGQDSMAFSTTNYSRTASTSTAQGDEDGFINFNVQFMDMNGDGLADKVVAYENSSQINVFYNDGSDFIFISGRSEWTDPFGGGCEASGYTAYCLGHLNAYINFGETYQWLFIQDMNGDSLPDRVRVVDSSTGDPTKVDFEIAFNNGTGWDTATSRWADPHPYTSEDTYIGMSTDERFFMDMNGDGLTDRVVGVNVDGEVDQYDGFNVYYNTGTGFNTTPQYWEDPIRSIDQYSGGIGKQYAADTATGYGIYAIIRDFNGDGLPDRLYEAEYNDSSGSQIGAGIVVFLNINGQEWAQAEALSDGSHSFDGVNVLGIVDESGEDERGYINKKNDWIDMNADGYLDRVVGDDEDGEFDIYFYKGSEYGSNLSYLSSVYTLTDPITDAGDDFSGAGHITNSHTDDGDQSEGEYYHTFLIDLNGDSYPDRVSISPRDFSSGSKSYVFYPMQVNSLEFSDSPTEWTNQNVNQPSGALKSVNNGNGAKTVIEYMPSTWPIQWSTTNSGLPITHRFLPFNMYLVHKVYSTDWSMSGDDEVSEAEENPFMRWITYWYYGGNFFVKHATSSESLFTQFNGFQTVEKIPFKSIDDTFDEFWSETVYHQALGDVYPVESADETNFESDGYSHFALSGKPYSQSVNTNSYTITYEESAYILNNSDASETFTCDDSYCYPKLSTHEKTVKEAGGAQTRFSKVEMEYDEYGNISSEKFYDNSGAVFLEKNTICYNPSSFSSHLQIRDRPSSQEKITGSSRVRYKTFSYDADGNPEQEAVDDGGGVTLSTIRIFNSDGTISQVTGTDGVTKVFGYDANGLFPITETMTLPSGGNLTTQREYHRYLGKPDYTEDNNGVAKEVEYDDFARPIAEYIVDTSGSKTTTKRYEYEYVSVNIESMTDALTVLKTQVWEPKPGHSDTETNPMKVAYADASGYTLQQCHYSERGDYRLMQQRLQNGGRTEIKTEPVFSSNCDFIQELDITVPSFTTYKDLQGRVVLQENPTGDATSPVGNVSFAYTVDTDGQLVKTITDTNGLTRVETYDDKERLIKVKDPTNNEIEYSYSDIGDLTDVIVGSQTLTHIDYDDLGRKTSMTDANMGTWSYEYDSNGRLDKQTDNAGNVVSYDYDSIGRITFKYYYDPANVLERYEENIYDSGDGVHAVNSGELYEVKELQADGTLIRSTKFGYSTDYRRINKITKNIVDLGELTQTVEHNHLGQVTNTTYPGGESVYYEYNRVGTLKKICNSVTCDSSLNQVYYSIDDNDFNVYGSITKESYGNGVETEYSYFPNSHRLQNRQIKKGSDIYSERSYEYDIYSNITKLADPRNSKGTGGLSSVSYDDLSRLIAYTPQDASTSQTLTYDNQGNILNNSQTYSTNNYEYTSSLPHAVTKIGSDTFTYDANGNMITDSDRTMTYNTKNQLTKVEMKNNMVVEYDYDYNGSRVSKKSKYTDAYGVEHIAETYFLGDALEIKEGKFILYLYAGSKRIGIKSLGTIDEIIASSSGSFKNHGIQPNTFRLATKMPISIFFFGFMTLFIMRPAGKWAPRFWRKTTQAIFEAAQALKYNTATKCACLFLIFLFVFQLPMHQAFAGDTGIAVPNASDDNYFYYVHGDHLGSSHIMTEGNPDGGRHAGITFPTGSLLQRIEYSPFGQEKYVLNPNLKTDPSFTGQKYDLETGLYYYKSRYYNPKLGRFIQADTIIPSATDYQSYNRYAYVRNNPLKYVDPSGHSFGSWFKKLGAAFLGAAIGVVVFVLVLSGFGIPLSGGLVTAIKSASLAEVMIAGAIGGAVGGAISGGISGGIKGAAFGALFGLIGGAVTAGFGKGLEKLGVEGVARFAILGSIGTGLSYATGGWHGLVTFGASIAGALVAGLTIDGLVANRIDVRSFSDGADFADRAGAGTENFRYDNIQHIEPSAVSSLQSGSAGPSKINNARLGEIVSIKANVQTISYKFNFTVQERASIAAAGASLVEIGAITAKTAIEASVALILSPEPLSTAAGLIGGSITLMTGAALIGVGGLMISEATGMSSIFIAP